MLDQHHVTAVIMNFDRPANVIQLVQSICSIRLISDIFIINAKESSKVEVHCLHVTQFDDWGMNEHVGLALRFVRAANAPTEKILFIDDDILPESWLIYSMFHDKVRCSELCGPFVRRCDSSGYSSKYINTYLWDSSKANTVITPLMLTTITVVRWFLLNMNKLSHLVINSMPLWNGEDILFGLVYSICSHKNGSLFVTPSGNGRGWSRLSGHNKGVSSSKGHLNYRHQLCKRTSVYEIRTIIKC